MAESPEQQQAPVDENVVDSFELDLEGLEQEGETGGDDGGSTEGTTVDTKTSNTKDTTASPTAGMTETEKIAYAQGWRPKDDFIKSGGDAGTWKEAGWWLDRGELLGQQSQLRKEVKQIKDAFVRMTEYNRQAYTKGQQDALAALKSQKREAMKAGDLETVADLDDRIDHQTQIVQTVLQEVKQPVLPQSAAEQQIEHSAMYQNWLRDNVWYTSDMKLHQYANAIMATYVKSNPNTTPEAALSWLTEEVKKDFAHKFAGTTKVVQPTVGGRGNQTQRGSGDSAGSIDSKFANIVGQMDADTRRAVIDLVRSGVISKKEYVADYGN
jgi:hypothetical protein